MVASWIELIVQSKYRDRAVVVYCLLAAIPPLILPHPIALLPLAAIPLGLLFILKKPFVVCLTFILFSFFRLHEVFPQLDPIKIPLLTALGSYFVLAWHIILTRKVKTYWRYEHTVFARFFGWVVVSIVFASHAPSAFASFTSVYMKIGIMVLAISWLMTETNHFKLAHLLILGAGLTVGCITLYNKASGIGLVEGTRVTIPGTSLGDPNDLSLVLSFPMSYAIAFAATRGTGKIKTLLGLIGFGVFISAIIATQSRGGLLAIIAVTGIFGLRLIKSKLLLISIASFSLVILIAAAGISDRKSGGAAEEGVDASAMGRIHAWEAAFFMGLRNPLTGVGLSMFLDNYWNYATHSRAEGMAHVTHSSWFQVLAETGFIGLGLFLFLIYTNFMSIRSTLSRLDKLRDTPNENPQLTAIAMGTYAGLAGFCASGSFLSQGFLWPIYIMTAICIAIANYMDNHYPEPEPELKNDEQTTDTKGKFANKLKVKGYSNAKPTEDLAKKQ
ncbi:O-antigen ligase family protein [Endozoicomonas montiporae]|uniref:Membrane protein of ExoQ family,involved in exopolysaccharide production n=1 Tax=Endozoicomonas montiporae CL-33 TaxID=570277 RepID=A0A142BGD6_9GAMM|nr:O-antigen ligase family protein [Endozoicomonas montiporae]AMO57812.1 membrane protein of ExoQ family,involved in exopolysaccharide production [Endozoicomonas montiporae CL-33]